MKNYIKASVLALGVMFLLSGCGEKSFTPAEPSWDRQTCEMCRMTVSDRRFSAQLVSQDNKRLFFDDLGCALRWMGKHPETAKGMKLFATDLASGKWIEVAKGEIVGGYKTPMAYGFGVTQGTVQEGHRLYTLQEAQELVSTASRSHGHGHMPMNGEKK
jgi:copper chaperone NosL